MISESDKQRFFDQGYLLVEDVVPESLCAAVRSTICEYFGMTEDDPGSWPERQSHGHGIVPIHHRQALWDLRQHPAVHQTFAALHGTEALWVTTDRVSFKTRDPGATEQEPAEAIHWDGNPTRLDSLSIQGLVYLTDTTADQGAFCCVPKLYRHLDGYLEMHPDHAESRRPLVDPKDIEAIPGPAGSMVLWHRKMPHSSSVNLTDRPRWVQYVAMDPVGDDEARHQRIAEFSDAMPPKWAIVQNVPGQELPEACGAAQLSELGRRLVGVDAWPARV
jgi:hypothetical protein